MVHSPMNEKHPQNIYVRVIVNRDEINDKHFVKKQNIKTHKHRS